MSFYSQKKFFLSSVWLIAISLTGCFPYSYKARPYTLYQTNLDKNVAEAFLTSAVADGEIEYERWWDFFQDPALSRFIELSLMGHPDMKIAEARIRRACQEARVTKSSLFPHFFLLGDINRQKISEWAPGFFPGAPDVFTEATLELTSASYELDIWQKNRSLYLAALDEMQATIADYEEAKLLLSTTIAAVYFDLQIKYERKKIASNWLEAEKELYVLYKQQFDLGIISEFRLYEVDSQVQLLKDLVFVLEGEIAIDIHALSALVGNVACCCSDDVVPCAVFDSPFPLPVTLPIDLLIRRPDITAHKWHVEAACFNIKAAKANFFPRIDLMGLIGFQSIKLDKLFTGQTFVLLGDATATLPLFLAGKLQGELGVAREDLEIAIEKYNQTVLLAVQQVSDALSDLTTADSRKKSIEKSIEDALHLLDLTEQKFQNGIVNKQTVLSAKENVYVQQDLGARIQLARFESAVELIRAIGGGYHDCSL